MIRTNAKGEMTLPFFQVGQPELDLQATLDLIAKANFGWAGGYLYADYKRKPVAQ